MCHYQNNLCIEKVKTQHKHNNYTKSLSTLLCIISSNKESLEFKAQLQLIFYNLRISLQKQHNYVISAKSYKTSTTVYICQHMHDNFILLYIIRLTQ